MKIAITGGTGFIGQLLVEKHISIGDEVHVLTRKKDVSSPISKKVITHHGNILQTETLVGFLQNIDVLYHCAAEILVELKMHETHVTGTQNLINAAIGNVKHWVQLSSVGVYGPTADGPVDEDADYNPINEYEKTKLEPDLLLLDQLNAKGISYSIIRPSNVIGTTMKNTSVKELIRAVDKGYFFFIGKSGASANYVPVDNVIAALYLAATHPNAHNKIYNISNWCTIEEFISYISEALKKPMRQRRVSKESLSLVAKASAFIPRNPLTIGRVNALTNRTIYITNRIENDLAYEPVVSIKKTVIGMVNNFNKSN